MTIFRGNIHCAHHIPATYADKNLPPQSEGGWQKCGSLADLPLLCSLRVLINGLYDGDTQISDALLQNTFMITAGGVGITSFISMLCVLIF